MIREAYGDNLPVFMKEYRKKNRITAQKLCRGLCDVSNYSSFETGKSSLSKSLQDRLLERMGVSAEDFFDLVGPSEYKKWQLQELIVYSIIKKDYLEAEDKINRFHKEYFEESKINKQFYYRMISYIKLYEGKEKELVEALTKCIEQSVPEFDINQIDEYALAIPEIDIILDCLFYNTRYTYDDIYVVLHYLENKRFNSRFLVNTYPKAVVYYFNKMSQSLSISELTRRELKELLGMCDKAVDLLGKITSLYYLWEILQIRRCIYEFCKDKKNMCDMLDENEININISYINAIESVYKLGGFSDYHTNENASIYITPNVKCINHVIKRRREMLRMSKAALARGLCEEKTIARIEKGEVEPRKSLAQDILERLNLPRDYTANVFLSNTIDDMYLMEEFRYTVNNAREENYDGLIVKLKEQFGGTNAYNDLAIKAWEATFQYRRKKLNNEAYVSLLQEVVLKTIDIENLFCEDNPELTNNEILFINQIVKHSNIKDSKCKMRLKWMDRYFLSMLGTPAELNYRSLLSVISETTQELFGECGDYEHSNECSRKFIKMCIHTKRIAGLPGTLYNIWWNENSKKTVEGSKVNPIQLPWCRDLAYLINDYTDHQFYVRKINSLMN